MTAVLSDRVRARVALVEEHVRRENAQTLLAHPVTVARAYARKLIKPVA